MLQENESYIKDKCNRHMLISILNVGHEIDKKHGNNRISHEEYNKEVRLFCPFLPNRRIWKHKSENI